MPPPTWAGLSPLRRCRRRKTCARRPQTAERPWGPLTVSRSRASSTFSHVSTLLLLLLLFPPVLSLPASVTTSCVRASGTGVHVDGWPSLASMYSYITVLQYCTTTVRSSIQVLDVYTSTLYKLVKRAGILIQVSCRKPMFLIPVFSFLSSFFAFPASRRRPRHRNLHPAERRSRPGGPQGAAGGHAEDIRMGQHGENRLDGPTYNNIIYVYVPASCILLDAHVYTYIWRCCWLRHRVLA